MMKKVSVAGGPPPGCQRMSMAHIVNFLFGPLPRKKREYKARTVNYWIHERRLLAERVSTGIYDVNIESLKLLRESLLPLRELVAE